MYGGLVKEVRAPRAGARAGIAWPPKGVTAAPRT